MISSDIKTVVIVVTIMITIGLFNLFVVTTTAKATTKVKTFIAGSTRTIKYRQPKIKHITQINPDYSIKSVKWQLPVSDN